MSVTPISPEVALLQMMDDWHRAEGHVLCTCNRWVHPDETVEGTCGAVDCLRDAEAGA